MSYEQPNKRRRRQLEQQQEQEEQDLFDRDDKHRSRRVPEWKQEVVDEEGRRRLHGAFKGGFSAGYFNTVGSAEGWKPSEFISSRSQRTGAGAGADAGEASKTTLMATQALRVTDIMDDEDKEELLDSWGQAAAVSAQSRSRDSKATGLRISGGIGTGVLNDLEDDDTVDVEIGNYALQPHQRRRALSPASQRQRKLDAALRARVPRELRKSLSVSQLRALGTEFTQGFESELPEFVLAAADTQSTEQRGGATTLLLLPRDVARRQLLSVPPFQCEEKRKLYRRYLSYHAGDEAALDGAQLGETDERDFYAAALAAESVASQSTAASPGARKPSRTTLESRFVKSHVQMGESGAPATEPGATGAASAVDPAGAAGSSFTAIEASGVPRRRQGRFWPARVLAKRLGCLDDMSVPVDKILFAELKSVFNGDTYGANGEEGGDAKVGTTVARELLDDETMRELLARAEMRRARDAVALTQAKADADAQIAAAEEAKASTAAAAAAAAAAAVEERGQDPSFRPMYVAPATKSNSNAAKRKARGRDTRGGLAARLSFDND